MIQTKKGAILYYFALVGFFLGLAAFFVSSLVNTPPEQEGYPGELQLQFIRSTKIAERAAQYIDVAADLSSDIVAQELALSGGFLDDQTCTHENYPLWNDECVPDIETNFESLFNKEMQHFIDTYDDNDKFLFSGTDSESKAIIPKAEYKIFFDDKKIVASNNGVITLQFNYKEKEFGGYVLHTDTQIPVHYNLKDEFNYLKEYTKIIRATCSLERLITDCVNILSQEEPDFSWEATCNEDDRSCLFDVESEVIVETFVPPRFTQKNLKYRFAIEFDAFRAPVEN